MFKVGASIIVIFLVFLNLAFCYRKKLQKCCSRCRGCQEVGENQSNRKSDDDATTKKEEEGDVDSSDADGSNGKDSDTMVDEEEKV